MSKHNMLKFALLLAALNVGMQEAFAACPIRSAYTRGSSPVVGGWQELGSYTLGNARWGASVATYNAQGSAFGEVCGGSSASGYTGCGYSANEYGGGQWNCLGGAWITITTGYTCPSNTAMIPVLNYRRGDGVLMSGTFTACVATDTY